MKRDLHDPALVDALAREVALGTATEAARRRFDHLLATDPAARKALAHWHTLLASCATAVQPVPPDPVLRGRVEARLFAADEADGQPRYPVARPARDAAGSMPPRRVAPDRQEIACMELVLYDWAPSPFCAKLRAVLDYKGLSYRRVPVMGPALYRIRRRGNGKVPALEIDGRMVTDSTDIAHALEALAPARPVLPQDPRQRALNQALEDWADETFYFQALYFQWMEPQAAPMVREAFRTQTSIPGLAGRLFGELAYRAYRRRIARQVIGQGTGRKPHAQIAADLARNLAAAAELLSPGPFLLGSRPHLCDFALMGQLAYLMRPPLTRAMVQAHAPLTDFLAAMRALRREPAQS